MLTYQQVNTEMGVGNAFLECRNLPVLSCKPQWTLKIKRTSSWPTNYAHKIDSWHHNSLHLQVFGFWLGLLNRSIKPAGLNERAVKYLQREMLSLLPSAQGLSPFTKLLLRPQMTNVCNRKQPRWHHGNLFADLVEGGGGGSKAKKDYAIKNLCLKWRKEGKPTEDPVACRKLIRAADKRMKWSSARGLKKGESV